MDDSRRNLSVPKPLTAEMRCYMYSNVKGETFIVHDEDLGGTLEWIEFSPQDDSFCLIYEDGQSRELGLTITREMKANLSHGTEILLVRLKDGQIADDRTVTLIVKDY